MRYQIEEKIKSKKRYVCSAVDRLTKDEKMQLVLKFQKLFLATSLFSPLLYVRPKKSQSDKNSV
jgi:hypothetical protein